MLANQARRLVELAQLEVYRARAVVADTLPEPIRLWLPANENAPALAEARVAFVGSGGRI